MPAKYNDDLIKEKFTNIHKRVDGVNTAVTDLEDLVKKEYTPMSTTNGIDKRVSKFEGFWDWGIKIVLGAMILGILAIIGLK
jgi:tetrahydromethanopterin S-methyltransferase subunit B